LPDDELRDSRVPGGGDFVERILPLAENESSPDHVADKVFKNVPVEISEMKEIPHRNRYRAENS
jgi:hypothetical protein